MRFANSNPNAASWVQEPRGMLTAIMCGCFHWICTFIPIVSKCSMILQKSTNFLGEDHLDLLMHFVIQVPPTWSEHQLRTFFFLPLNYKGKSFIWPGWHTAIWEGCNRKGWKNEWNHKKVWQRSLATENLIIIKTPFVHLPAGRCLKWSRLERNQWLINVWSTVGPLSGLKSRRHTAGPVCLYDNTANTFTLGNFGKTLLIPCSWTCVKAGLKGKSRAGTHSSSGQVVSMVLNAEPTTRHSHDSCWLQMCFFSLEMLSWFDLCVYEKWAPLLGWGSSYRKYTYFSLWLSAADSDHC